MYIKACFGSRFTAQVFGVSPKVYVFLLGPKCFFAWRKEHYRRTASRTQETWSSKELLAARHFVRPQDAVVYVDVKMSMPLSRLSFTHQL